jgi:hypothetical protein
MGFVNEKNYDQLHTIDDIVNIEVSWTPLSHDKWSSFIIHN